MRISDWSSDVCSSDLAIGARLDFLPIVIAERGNLDLAIEMADVAHDGHVLHRLHVLAGADVLVARGDRMSVVSGKRVSVLVEFGCRRVIRNKNRHTSVYCVYEVRISWKHSRLK